VAPPVRPPLAEPVAAKASPREEHKKGSVVGIDLGTTYSLVAFVEDGKPCCIPNENGDLLTPSAVLFDEGGVVVGKEALLAAAMEPEKVAQFVKRDMGAKVYRKKINGEYLPPEVISSLILRNLKTDTERRRGPVTRAVITVPAYFEETRRRATMAAGRLAGLEVLDIINEPTAAAIAYGHQLGFLDRAGHPAGGSPLRVLVYDLGGGTFDVTIVEIRPRGFKVRATDGDTGLGGKDWDDRLIDLAAERFRQRFREDPRDNPVSLQELRLAVEAAKRTLTERGKATLYVNHLGERLKVEVTREEFEKATADLLERTRISVEIVLRQAGLDWSAIDRILLVGGSTRMPMIGRLLEEMSGRPPDRSVCPDQAVAQGAALYAESLAPLGGAAGAQASFSVQDVASHGIGILGSDPKTGRKANRVIIPKNTPLPRTVTRSFRTLKRDQKSVLIHVLEGESERPEACSRVGTCEIRDLPPDLPAGWPVRVRYTYEANGRLHVSARVKGHEAAVTADFICENSITDEDLRLLWNAAHEASGGRA
jgi:molecular chaperone DnaK